ncbi:hypothetical protein GH714_026590 [Hevea brasiliensis]|uniref:Saposin B-type domain-containing protein n=1 Tax=Hevea brasiliensis TaxID=3981 RepID=A0A6A6LRG1_HEVBR|nr:hypothetical protein GH714_026590 [Hevea brasiliensis]
MANMKQILIVLVTLLVVSTWVPVSFSAKKPVFAARKEDIPFIKCQITEYQIIELAENVCNLKKEEADWIMKIDIVEQGDKLELVEQDTEGQCNSECKTIEQACEQVVGYSDTDIAEYIFSSKPDVDSLVNYLCKDLTNSCRKKPPPVPKDRTPGEPFVPKPAKDAEMEKILRSMEAKVMRGKESRNDDWKQKITEGLKNTGETLKRHANKVSNRLRQWWKRIKAARTNKNSNAGKLEL